MGIIFKIEDTSGNAYKKGTRTLAGVVDQSYTGNVGVVLYNTSDVPIEINVGDKIAQMILHKVPWVSSINAVGIARNCSWRQRVRKLWFYR